MSDEDIRRANPVRFGPTKEICLVYSSRERRDFAYSTGVVAEILDLLREVDGSRCGDELLESLHDLLGKAAGPPAVPGAGGTMTTLEMVVEDLEAAVKAASEYTSVAMSRAVLRFKVSRLIDNWREAIARSPRETMSLHHYDRLEPADIVEVVSPAWGVVTFRGADLVRLVNLTRPLRDSGDSNVADTVARIAAQAWHGDGDDLAEIALLGAQLNDALAMIRRLSTPPAVPGPGPLDAPAAVLPPGTRITIELPRD